MTLLVDHERLAMFCERALRKPFLAVDTEFIRQSTLMPKLGLIQLYDGENLALVDPLAISDWRPLQELFASPTVVKVLHSCTEDLEALFTIGIREITPLFDTQLAAEILGWGGSIGYGRIVERLTGAKLDKSEARTDWLARPLAEKQLAYAADDVKYLLPVYERLVEECQEQAKLTWLLAEGQQLLSRRNQQLPDRFKYLDIKNSTQLHSRELAVLRELVSWRYQYAVQRDLALGLVVKDAQLLDLAKRRPGSVESLLNIPGMDGRDTRRHAKVLITLIAEAKALSPEDCPQPFYHLPSFPGEKIILAEIGQAVKQAAEAYAIPSSFLSTRRQLHEYFNWCWRVTDEARHTLPMPEYVSGWRATLLKEYLNHPRHVASYLD